MKGLFRPNEYFRPSSIGEAVSLLAKYGERARIVAGGTNLFVSKPPDAEVLVDITRLPLDYMKGDGEGFRIGALTTFRSLEKSEFLKKVGLGVLAEAATGIGSISLRNMATVGGNICKALPITELCPTLMVLGASLRIAGPSGERVVMLDEFFVGHRKIALESDELLIDVVVPPIPPRSGAAFIKVGRLAEDISIVNAAAFVALEGDGICSETKIAVGGGMGPFVKRAKEAEALLKGQMPEADLVRLTAKRASEEFSPRPMSIRGSAQYKLEICKVIVERVLNEAIKRASRED